jgi:hypothetical protein
MLAENDFLVLNAIYLKKMTPAATVAEVLDLPLAGVQAVVAGAVENGQVLDMEGQLMLDSAGSEAVLEFYRETYAALATDAEMLAFYQRFEGVNTPFIKLVSDWQTSEGDERAKEKIIKVVEKHCRALDDIAPRIGRYAGYARRFERTMARVDAGERELVSNPRLDSLHNIWFEFHEDVLAVMGRPRES